MLVVQFAIGLQGAQQLALRELAHFQDIFDGRAIAANRRGFGAAGNRQYLKVKAVGQALVQAQFFLAKVFARRQFAEVEEAEVDRLLDLVRIGAGEQHPGDMRLDYLESVYGMWVEGRVLQGGNQGLAHG
ncbi:hypothetical protein D3C87_1814580 [compost metagenome]